MTKKTTRIIAVILVVLMCLSMLPLMASAENENQTPELPANPVNENQTPELPANPVNENQTPELPANPVNENQTPELPANPEEEKQEGEEKQESEEKETVCEHAWDEGKVTKEATCTEKGEKTFTCTKCEATKTEEIAALGHDFKDGTCTRCNTAETFLAGDTKLQVSILGSGTVFVDGEEHAESFEMDVNFEDVIAFTFDPADGSAIRGLNVDGAAAPVVSSLSYTVEPGKESNAVSVTFDTLKVVAVETEEQKDLDVFDPAFPSDETASERTTISVYDVSLVWASDDGELLPEQKALLSGDPVTVALDFFYYDGADKDHANTSVWHQKADKTLEKISKVTDLGNKVRFTQPDNSFSLFAVLSTPVDFTGKVTLSGKTNVGQTLKASISGTNNTGVMSISRWTREDEAGNEETIPDANKINYTLTIADIGKKIRCYVKSSVELGEVASDPTAPISAVPLLTVDLRAINENNPNFPYARGGVVSGVLPGMEYADNAAFNNAKDVTEADVTDAGVYAIKDLASGNWYVRVKTPLGATRPYDYATVYVDTYYTVDVGPGDSVSGNRANVTAKIGGSTEAPWITGDTSLDKVFLVEPGDTLSLTITTTKKDYRINRTVTYNLATGSETSKSVNSTSTTLSVATIRAPYAVDVYVGTTGSTTGDNSHLGFWTTAAVLSAMAIGAAVTIAKKKLWEK